MSVKTIFLEDHWTWPKYSEENNYCKNRERSHLFLIRGFPFFLPATNSIYNLQQLNSEQQTNTESERLFLDLQKTAADKGFDIDNNRASGESVLDILSQQLRRVKGIKNSHEQIRQGLVPFLQNFPNRVRTLLERSLLLNLIRMI